LICKLASRYAFSHKNRHNATSIRIALGLALSVLALNIVISFMVGLQSQRFSQIREYTSYDAIISDIDGNVSDLHNTLLSNSDIDESFIFVELPAIVGSGEEAIAGTLRAFGQEDLESLPYHIIAGDPSQGLIVSYSMMRKMGWTLHESIQVILLAKGKTATVVPRSQQVTIGAIYYTPVTSFNSTYFLMNKSELALIAGDYQESEIAVRGNLDTIETLVGEKGTMKSWIDQNTSLYAAMKMEQIMMYLMLSLMSFIILVNLYSSNRNLLDDTLGEFMMLRVMGCRTRDICSIFTLQSFFVSCVGVGLGTMLSIVILTNAASILTFFDTLSGGVYPLLSAHLALTYRLNNLIEVAIPIMLIALGMAIRPVMREMKNAPMEIVSNE